MPVMRYNKAEQSMMRHPDSLNLYTSDFYLSPLSVESPDDHAVQSVGLVKGESKETDSLRIRFDDFDFSNVEKGKMLEGGGFTIGVFLTVEKNGKSYPLKPLMKNDQGSISYVPAVLGDGGIE